MAYTLMMTTVAVHAITRPHEAAFIRSTFHAVALVARIR